MPEKAINNPKTQINPPPTPMLENNLAIESYSDKLQNIAQNSKCPVCSSSLEVLGLNETRTNDGFSDSFRCELICCNPDCRLITTISNKR